MIRKLFLFFAAVILLMSFESVSEASFLDNLIKGTGITQQAGSKQDEGTIASGLKEALSVGTQKAVSSVSVTDGYFGNQAIKILMPEKIQKVAEVMKKIGYISLFLQRQDTIFLNQFHYFFNIIIAFLNRNQILLC